MPESSDRRGSLVVVGCGIRAVGQLTVESIAQIRAAEQVLTLLCDPIAAAVVERLNPGRCESLADLYARGKPRSETYREMADRVLDRVRAGARVCLVTYGHPAIFATPTHEAVRRARAEGFAARLLAAVSAEDCLFADLGLDPMLAGCTSLEATDYLTCRYQVDPACLLILWQVGAIGVPDQPAPEGERFGLTLLTERLAEDYPPDHPVTIYRASILPNQAPFALTVPLSGLPEAEVPGMATLCVPPRAGRTYDHAMIGRLQAARDAARGGPKPTPTG